MRRAVVDGLARPVLETACSPSGTGTRQTAEQCGHVSILPAIEAGLPIAAAHAGHLYSIIPSSSPPRRFTLAGKRLTVVSGCPGIANESQASTSPGYRQVPKPSRGILPDSELRGAMPRIADALPVPAPKSPIWQSRHG